MRAVAACFLSAAFLSAPAEAGKASFLNPEYVETFGVRLWQNHKQDYNREYPGAGTEGSEDWGRFLNFKEVLKHAHQLNTENPSATFGFNTFTDYYPEEFLRVMAGTQYPVATASDRTGWEGKMEKGKKAAESRDFTRDGVAHVKHQSNCTAGAVFAFVAAAEAGAVRDGLPLRPLSEQWVLSCSGLKTQDLDPCSGTGENRPNLEAVAKAVVAGGGGMPAEADGFYTASDGKLASCPTTPAEAAVRVTEVVKLPEDDKLLRRWMDQNGPFAAEVDALDWQTYQDGVVDVCEEGGKVLEGEVVRGPGHAVLVTGYGTEEGHNYWTAKNSWGFAWGEHGYVRLRRGRGCLRSPIAIYTAKPQKDEL